MFTAAGKAAVWRPPVTTLVLHTSVTNDGSSTITVPSSVQPGDVAVLFDRSTSTGAHATPASWTSVSQPGTTNASMCVSVKVLLAADVGAAIAGMSVGTLRKTLLVFRGNVRARSMTVSALDASIGSVVSSRVHALARSGALPPFVALVGAVGPNQISAGRPNFDSGGGTLVENGASLCVRYEVFNSAALDTNARAAWGGSDVRNGLVSFCLGVT